MTVGTEKHCFYVILTYLQLSNLLQLNERKAEAAVNVTPLSMAWGEK